MVPGLAHWAGILLPSGLMREVETGILRLKGRLQTRIRGAGSPRRFAAGLSIPSPFPFSPSGRAQTGASRFTAGTHHSEYFSFKPLERLRPGAARVAPPASL